MMNPRERVLTALNHQEPDKVPIDLGGTIVTTLTRIVYQNLRTYLGMPPDDAPVISHRQMDTVYPREDLLQLYEVDVRAVAMKGPWCFEPREMPDDSFYDEFNIRWKKASYYYDVVERPLADATIHDLATVAWPDPYDPGRVAGLREEAQALYENTEYAIVADIMCLGPFEGGCVLRGYEQFLTDLYWDPRFAEALLDKITETDIALWDAFLNAVGDYVHVVAQGDDVGIQTGPYISPEMYRKFIKPRQRRIFDFIHSKTQAKIFYHSCGSVYDLIPDFIEIGVDILNPIQRSAKKMDIARMKREFGKDLCFWGGAIDVQQVLPFATRQQIEDEIKRTLEIMAPGGGYVFFPSHNIQADVSPDRIHHMYQTALQYRDYRKE
ncbi:MAG: uroporphyrinogen-III decarboxylase [Anaerolineae bacterium]|nr:uroporphyrinogen-III decarboxylase [Anaerolineae bacterium]MDW8071747.1 uroporphyrinogen decarboxylase family protein [Anaerolineae bacterium]